MPHTITRWRTPLSGLRLPEHTGAVTLYASIMERRKGGALNKTFLFSGLRGWMAEWLDGWTGLTVIPCDILRWGPAFLYSPRSLSSLSSPQPHTLHSRSQPFTGQLKHSEESKPDRCVWHTRWQSAGPQLTPNPLSADTKCAGMNAKWHRADREKVSVHLQTSFGFWSFFHIIKCPNVGRSLDVLLVLFTLITGAIFLNQKIGEGVSD